MLLKHLFEDKNNKAQDAKELLDKVSTPSAISKATQLLRQILQNINPNQTIEEPPVSEDLNTDKEFAKNAIDEIAKTGNQEQLNAVISFLRGAELNELSSKAILANISQGIKGGLDQKLGQLVQNINAPFAQKEVFLNKMASGEGFSLQAAGVGPCGANRCAAERSAHFGGSQMGGPRLEHAHF